MADERVDNLPEGASSRERPAHGGGIKGALREAGEAAKDTLEHNQAHSEAGAGETGGDASSIVDADAHVTDRERP